MIAKSVNHILTHCFVLPNWKKHYQWWWIAHKKLTDQRHGVLQIYCLNKSLCMCLGNIKLSINLNQLHHHKPQFSLLVNKVQKQIMNTHKKFCFAVAHMQQLDNYIHAQKLQEICNCSLCMVSPTDAIKTKSKTDEHNSMSLLGANRIQWI